MADTKSKYKGLYNKTYKGARNRNIFWELSQKQFDDIVSKKCDYCKKQPTQMYSRKIYYNGIDRKDNKKGYTIENCVPCCSRCNKIKGETLTYDETKIVIKVLKSTQR